MYLSTTDYVQHKHAPGHAGGQRVLRDDERLPASSSTRWAATIALTADHGMNAKTDAAGRAADPVPAGLVRCRARRRQGARDPAGHRSVRRPPRLARLVRDRLPAGGRRRRPPSRRSWRRCRASRWCSSREEAAERFELPTDRIGDLVIVSERLYVIGTSPSRHDLSGLDAPLRSHGGISEQLVPLLFNRRWSRRRPGAAPAQLRHLRSGAEPRRLNAASEEPAMKPTGNTTTRSRSTSAPASSRPCRRCCAAARRASSPSPRRAASACCRGWRSSLGAALVGVIDQTQPNPDVDGLDALYRAFWREHRERAR